MTVSAMSTAVFKVEQVKLKSSSSTTSTVPPLFMGFPPEVAVKVPKVCKRYNYNIINLVICNKQ